MDELYRISQVAKEFGVTTRTVQRWVRTEVLKPDGWTAGGHARFSRSTLDFLRERLRKEHDIPKDRGHWVMVRLDEPYPRHPSLTIGEAEAALYEFWPQRRVGLIPIEQYREDWQRMRELLKAAVERKRADRIARMNRWLHERFGMTRRELYDAVWSEAVRVVAKRFGISDQALRKTCKRYKIPVPPRGYWRNLLAKQKTKRYERPPLPVLR